MNKYDTIIIGGGPAGMAAAISAYDNGCDKVLLIERDERLGGILNQCIHNGFGLQYFKKELTGPSYAQQFIHMIHETKIEILLNTMVINVSKDKCVTYLSPVKGMGVFTANTIIYAMGCRERTREALTIPGDRCAGIYTAGSAQYLLNIEGCLPGKEVVILGSGDIGLIMARRLTLEGAHVQGVFEIMDHPGGLKRNIVQCLEDYGIPLYLHHTVTRIIGNGRVEAVEIAKVDAKRQPIASTKNVFFCDTLLLSVGLLPEVELLKHLHLNMDSRTNGPIINNFMETSMPGVYACGNVAYVHDLVDVVSREGEIAGKHAAVFGKEQEDTLKRIETSCGNNVSMLIPQQLIRKEKSYTLRYRIPKDLKCAVVKLINEKGKGVYECVRQNMSASGMHMIVVRDEELHGNHITLHVEEVAQ